MHVKDANIVVENNTLIVSGKLNFSTVMTLWNESLPLIANYAALHFDLSRVTTANSAGLALLLEWIKRAQHEKKSITFDHVPAQLRSIATVSGIDKML